MRIIDTRKDYYDCVQRSGFDKTIIYLRKESEIDIPVRVGKDIRVTKEASILNKLFCVYFDHNSFKKCNYSIEFNVIGFCGKIYPCIVVSYKDATTLIKDPYSWSSNSEYVPKQTFDCLYDIEHVDHLVEKITPAKYLNYYNNTIRPKLLDFFKAAIEFGKDDFVEKIFNENKSPIFHISGRKRYSDYKIVLNCLLKDFQFYRVFDTNRAYQEVAMYMGNFAREFKPVPIIDDENKILTHGFNKYSFRKDPTKIRKKRK